MVSPLSNAPIEAPLIVAPSRRERIGRWLLRFMAAFGFGVLIAAFTLWAHDYLRETQRDRLKAVKVHTIPYRATQPEPMNPVAAEIVPDKPAEEPPAAKPIPEAKPAQLDEQPRRRKKKRRPRND